MPSLKEVVKQLRLTYLSDGIHKALDLYLSYIPFDVEAFQLSDFHMAVEKPESAWIRTRRGGKSRDLTIIAVFLALLEYIVVWRAPYSDQLKQASLYFQNNPFVTKIAISSRNEVDIAFSPSIEIGSLTIGKTASLGCDCLIYDEGGKVEKDKLMYQNYLYSRAMIAASTRVKHIIHGTTPAIYTAIEEVKDSLDTSAISTHPYTDCHWIPDAFVEDEKKKHLHDPWYIDQEYLCLFVVRGGAVFTNIATYDELGLVPPPNYTHVGVDFNGVDHMFVRIAYDDKYIYCAPDLQFKDAKEYKPYWDRFQSIEIEEGGYNAGFSKYFPYSSSRQAVTEEWHTLRLEELKRRTIVVDTKLNYGLIKNLREAMYDEKKPVIKKRNDQHFLDALLHAVNTFKAIIHTKVIHNTDELHNQGDFGWIQ